MRRVLLLALLALLPLAAADHVYSHRIVVTGRVIDAEGLPVPSQPVRLRFLGMTVGDAPCFDSRNDRTGPQGDFTLCRHAHAMPDGVRVNVTVGNASVEVPLDPALRKASARLRLPEATPAHDLEGERLFARTFRVEGRVMQLAEGPTSVEGVNVTSVPIGGAGVNVTLAANGTVLANANVTTNEHGDYAVDLDAGTLPEDAVLRVTAAGVPRLELPPRDFRRADVTFVLGSPGGETLPTLERPGTRTPEVPLPWPLVLAALALAAAGLRKR